MRWQLYLFLLLPLVYILIFAYYPMFGVQIAFKDFIAAKGIWGSEWVGLKHFKAVFLQLYVLKGLDKHLEDLSLRPLCQLSPFDHLCLAY